MIAAPNGPATLAPSAIVAVEVEMVMEGEETAVVKMEAGVGLVGRKVGREGSLLRVRPVGSGFVTDRLYSTMRLQMPVGELCSMTAHQGPEPRNSTIAACMAAR